MSYWLLAARTPEEVNAAHDTIIFAAVGLGVWILSLFIFYLLIKYAVLDALRVNRWESERSRGR